MTYATSLTIDDSHTLEQVTYSGEQITAELVTDLVNRLDGERHTLLTIDAGGPAHMAIGGDCRIGLIVYETADNLSFHNLLSEDPNGHDKVTMVAGGQPGDFKVRLLVRPEQATLAAVHYVLTGGLAEDLAWEFDGA